MKPSLGRIVIYRNTLDAHFLSMNNGMPECAAVVTRVWSDTCVNLKLLLDGHATDWITSVVLAPAVAPVDTTENPSWRWPERV